jgi:hypothetical protein
VRRSIVLDGFAHRRLDFWRLCQISSTLGAIPLQQLTDQGRQRIDELAHRYSVSTDAVMTLLRALVNNNGNMAEQFLAPEA